jgi:asparagine synthase (glutamine-hydrolysing)
VCGIAGILNLDGEPVRRESVARMANAMAHRGPDDSGLYVQGSIGLGHRRLAIIDLTEAGRQPMVDELTGNVLVFNGEIYNFPALRKELEASGSRFRSHSDTEVILHGFREWGSDLWDRLDGFFSIAMWVPDRAELYLVRDAFGVKPLYYFRSAETTAFASELKGLVASEVFRPQVSLQGLSDYFSLFYVPQPQTAIEDVWQVPPATEVVVSAQGSRVRQFWRPEFTGKFESLSVEAIQDRIREESGHAVLNSLLADVPIGTLLSGGLDSNIILYELLKANIDPIETLTVGFKAKAFDESHIVTEVLRTAHPNGAITFVDEVDVGGDFDSIVWHTDSLNANFAAIAEYQLFSAAQGRFKVALAGMGNDELFAGYSTYSADWLRREYRTFVSPKMRGIITRLTDWMPSDERKYGRKWMLRKFAQGSEMEFPESHFYWRSILNASEKQALLPWVLDAGINPNPMPNFLRHYNALDGFNDASRLLYADLQTFCIDNANVLMDAMSMAYSIEVRPPFLSKQYASFALEIPYNYKVHRFQTKKILRDAYRGRVHPSVTGAKKTGLVSPIAKLLKDDLFSRACHEFHSVEESSFLNPHVVKSNWKQFVAGRSELAFSLYLTLTYLTWRRLLLGQA